MKAKVVVKLFSVFYLFFFLQYMTALAAKAKSKKNISLALIEFKTKDKDKDSLFTTKSIYEIVLQNLMVSKRLHILDRSKLADILNEKALLQSGLTSEENIKQAASLILADYILSGEVIFQKDEARLTVKLFNASTGELKTIAFASGDRSNEIFTISDKVSGRILKVLTGEKFHPPRKKKIRKNKQPFTIETNAIQNGNLFLFVKIKVAGKKKASKRQPVNLVIVIDRSSSMSEGGKMEHSKKAIHYMIDQMQKKDLLTLVAFDSKTEVLIPPTAGDRREFAHHRVNKMMTHFNTNLSAGVLEGYKQLLLNKRRFKLNHLIIITDGLANLGITENQEIWKIITKNLTKGITVSTIGLGEEYDEVLLAGIAKSGGGNYYYVKQPSEISSIASKELKGLLPVVLKEGYFEFKTQKGLTIKTANGKPVNSTFIKKSFATLRAEQVQRFYFRISGPKRLLKKKKIATVKFYYSRANQNRIKSITRKIMNHNKLSDTDRVVMHQIKVSELMYTVQKTLNSLNKDEYKKNINRLVKESNSIYSFALKSRNMALLDEYRSLRHCINELLSLAEWGKLHPHDSQEGYGSDQLQKALKEVHFQRYNME